LRQGFLNYLPIGGLIGLILLIELLLVLGTWIVVPEVAADVAAPTPPVGEVSNIAALGALIYTRYVYFFLVAGHVLLVAMIGAIVLTLRHTVGVKRQDTATQTGRTREGSIEVVSVPSRRGI
jgi:NADH-quinone oxidoreductase subunit J